MKNKMCIRDRSWVGYAVGSKVEETINRGLPQAKLTLSGR